MSLHISDIEYLRAGWQKVVDGGQYGSTIYVFKIGDKLNAHTNKNQGVGVLIETITAAVPGSVAVVDRAAHGLNSEPANFGVTYEGNGEKL
jgi:hypothetical protein